MPSSRQSLHLSIDWSPYDSNSMPHTSTSDSSSVGNLSTSPSSSDESSSGAPDWRICSALCLFDFFSDDPTHLSFAKNDLLEIVQQEESGWWAALKLPDNNIGWISSAFVITLSDEMAERLWHIPKHQRILEYDAATLTSPSFAPVVHNDDSKLSPGELLQRSFNWVPNINTKVSEQPTEDIPNDILNNIVSPVSDTAAISSESDSYFLADDGRFQDVGQSPTTPIQLPIPPISMKPGSPRPLSVPSQNVDAPAIETHNRSQSESLPHRHLRRRPLLLDDRTSLNRLTTLIESHNTAELDLFASRPLEYVDAFSRLALKSPALRTGKMRPTGTGRDGDQVQPGDAFPFHGIRSPRPASSWFLRPSYNDNEVWIDIDGTLKAATLPALIERLTLDYLRPSQELQLRHTVLITFRTFASSDAVFDLIVDRFRLEPPRNLEPDEYEEWKDKKLRPTQRRVLIFLNMWLEEYNMVREEPHIARRLKEFLLVILEPQPLSQMAKHMLQTHERLNSSLIPPYTPLTPATPRHRGRKGFTPDLLGMDATEMAQQLCLLEHRLYAKIRTHDCWALRRAPNALSDFCSTHDKLAAWVESSVLNADGMRKKTDLIDFWISCADKCKAMRNISSMNAIITTLISASISRCATQIGRRSTLDKLVKFGDPANNFVAYRSYYQSIEGPCVPFIGMYLMEISNISSQYPDTVPSNSSTLTSTPLINFSKRQKWTEVIQPMLKFQSKSYSFSDVSHTMDFIERNLTIHDSEALRSNNSGVVQGLELAEIPHIY